MKNRAKRHRVIITVITTIITLASVLILSSISPTRSPSLNKYAVAGTIDLSDIDFRKERALCLDGEWEYYPGRLVAPGDFESYTPEYKTLPEKIGSVDRKNDEGTYHLTIKISRTQTHLAMTIPQIFSDYHVITNHKAIESNGFFKGESSVYPRSLLKILEVNVPVIELIVYIHNDGYVMPGIDGSFEIGDADYIDNLSKLRFAFDLAFSVLPLFIGFYFMILYIYERQFKKYLFFSLLCVAFTMRMLMINEVVLLQLFPGIPFNVGYVIKSISVPAIFAGAVRIANEYSGKYISSFISKTSYIISLLYAVVLIFVPYTYASYLTNYFLVLMTVCITAVSIRMFICAISPNQKAIPAYSGFLILSLCFIHDSLAYMRIINSAHVLGYGFFAYIVIYSVLLAKSYSESYHHIRRLSSSLRRALDRAESTEAAYLNAQMKPHFLYNTLNTIAEYCTTDPKQAEHLIIVLARFLRGTIDYGAEKSTVPLEKEISHAREYTEILAARFPEIDFSFTVPDCLPPALIPPMILQPLIENCVNHGIRKREGSGCVDISFTHEKDHVIVRVVDDGAGITDERLETILNYPDDTGRIGLYNVDHRLRREFGEGIGISTELGMGTEMTFRIPVITAENSELLPKEGKIDQSDNS